MPLAAGNRARARRCQLIGTAIALTRQKDKSGPAADRLGSYAASSGPVLSPHTWHRYRWTCRDAGAENGYRRGRKCWAIGSYATRSHSHGWSCISTVPIVRNRMSGNDVTDRKNKAPFPPAPPPRRPSPPFGDRGPHAVRRCWAPRRRGHIAVERGSGNVQGAADLRYGETPVRIQRVRHADPRILRAEWPPPAFFAACSCGGQSGSCPFLNQAPEAGQPAS
jgi:hypothetical protein